MMSRKLAFLGLTALVLAASECSAGLRWKKLSVEVRPGDRTGHDMVYDSGRNTLTLFGGSQSDERFGDTWEFDLEGQTWSLREDLALSPPPLTAHRMVYDQRNERTVLFGGQPDLFNFIDEIWEFDGASWSKPEIADGTGPVARGGHAFAYDESRGTVLLFGGRKRTGETSVELLNDTWIYDPTDRSWTPVETDETPSPREGAGLVYDASRDRFVLFGGGFFEDDRSDETWVFDPSAGTWSEIEIENPPEPRAAPSMAALQDGRIVLFGGTRYFRRYLGDTWVFNGANWEDLDISDPSRRAGAPLVKAGTEAYLFGGFNGDVQDDTWRLYPREDGEATPTPAPTVADTLTPTPTFTPTATPVATPPPLSAGDLNGDGRTSGLDLFILTEQYRADKGPNALSSLPDQNNDDRMDAKDVAAFVRAYRSER